MMKRTILALGLLSIAACAAPAAPTQEEQVQQQIEQEQSQRLAQNQNNAELNWILIGISTSKYGEQISTAVFKTYIDCEREAREEANACIPTAALPESYWR